MHAEDNPRSTHERNGCGRRRHLKPTLTVLWVIAGLVTPFAHGKARPTLAGALHSQNVQATVYSGNVRVTLMTSAADATFHRLILRLSEGNHPLINGPVLVTVSRLLQRPGKAQRMRQRGTAYQADLPFMQDGLWELLLQMRDASSQVHRVPFLVHLESGPHTGLRTIYPLFAPVNGWSPAISLPLGPSIADVQASIAPFGQTRFRIRLWPQSQHPPLPAQLRLQLSMIDMAMGNTNAIAQRVQPGLYRAEGFFSMPGAWRVALATGRVRAAAALVVGGRA